jgi:elongation factor Ts
LKGTQQRQVMTITATMVKDLREKTGAGMMDCKAALNETAGDLEAAVDWLRTKGLAKAAKKAGRVAAEGLIGIAAEAKQAVLVEVNSETDFVARNKKFQELVSAIAAAALKVKGDLDKLAAAKYGSGKETVAETVKQMIGSIGENMSLRRAAHLVASKGVVASYMHNTIAPGLGKIGVIVALESTGDAEKLQTFGRQVAMHIAAANPQSVDVENLDKAVIERERAVLTEQAKESGKPAPVIEKMVEGRLRKFYEEVVLLAQPFVHDPETTVAKALADTEKAAGAPIKITGFYRFALGEGIDRPDSDFAAEVAAAASGS